MMDLQLAGKRVLVTGASRGMGLAIAEAFLAEGASVTATARRSSPELDATAADFVPADLATPNGPRELVEAARAIDPHLDVLVNNAGGGEMPPNGFADEFDGNDDDWTRAFALNLHAAVRTTRAALPALTAARGAVVNISSDVARRVSSDPLPYRAAKAALNAFSRGLAERVSTSGIRVNSVSPAATRTPLLTGPDTYAARVAAGLGINHDDLLAALPKQIGMLTEVLIEPDEIARVVLILASPTMPSVIGANWAVDAGSIKAV
jgi:NAD(P)-dependent dehydrogenase (short-subunit alcohol dehydrogenase family)